MNKEQANQECLRLNNNLDRHSKTYYKVIYNVQKKCYEIVRVG